MEKLRVGIGSSTQNVYGELIEEHNGRIAFRFGFNRQLNEDIKAYMTGYKFDPARKLWSIENSEHNKFQLDFMRGANVYGRWLDETPVEINPQRKVLRSYQIEALQHILRARHCVMAYEMGLGKTLIAIEALEHFFKSPVPSHEVWYVSPRSALVSAIMEFQKWNSFITPTFMTYEGMLKRVKSGPKTPKALFFDEASRLKTPTSQRTEAAAHAARSLRKEHGYNSLIVLMTGSPAPKSPADWWSLCEIARPGYLRDGSIRAFQNRYAITDKQENTTGQVYTKILGWRDNEKRCAVCGKADKDHLPFPMGSHQFQPTVNEVAKLYGRMKGLTFVKTKKDCLDLPPKVYQQIQVELSPEIRRAAKLIASKATRAIEVLTRLRELSDGFQYNSKLTGQTTCGGCYGNIVPNSPPCLLCGGSGKKAIFEQTITRVASPKDDALHDILESRDSNRLVVYGAFTETIDRICDVCRQCDWSIIRVDGRGCLSPYGDLQNSLQIFQDRSVDKKIVFVGHPQAAGMGITLTASDTIVYYSNTFQAEDRIQSEDRIHRLGMGESALIVDLIGLPSDLYVLENLRKKRELQDITIGELHEAILKDGPEITYDR